MTWEHPIHTYPPKDALKMVLADNERLRALSQNNARSWDAIVKERDELRAEVEWLTERGMEAEAWCNQLNVEIEQLRADNERLRAALQKIADDGKNCSDYCRRQARAALEPKP